jgi:prepilin-type N-terminal cleavage/methylation domain-containing protein
VRPDIRRPPGAPAPSDPGFSLVELLVALVLVATTASALAALFVVSARAAMLARQRSSMTALAVQKAEQLGALAWTFDPWSAGTPLSDTTSDLGQDPISASGPGLQPSPPDSLDRNAPGFVDFLDAHGRWVGSGATAPVAAVFVRRWWIQAAAADPDTLVLQVVVTTAAADRAFGQAAWRARGLFAAGLTLLRTRKAP